MSKNIVKGGPDDALVNRIAALETALQQLKSQQSISADYINGGTITGVTITGTNINGSVVTLGPVTGYHVVMKEDSGVGRIEFLDSSGSTVGLISSNATQIIEQAGATALFIDSSTGVAIVGNFSATGTKAFDTEHPDGTEGKRLRYIAAESPEVLVICRGTGETPSLPDHFVLITEPGSVQYVIGEDGNEGKCWIATGIRKGYADFEPEYTTEK